MAFPQIRNRRLRNSEAIRRMVRETSLSPDDLILPLFAVPGLDVKLEIASMPGCYHFSADLLAEEASAAFQQGIPAVLLFGVPSARDEEGRQAWDDDGVVQRAIRQIKRENPQIVVITDVCLCEYTSHGHCGIVENGIVDNDRTLEVLQRIAVSHAEAGADIVAPSDMMDGRVGAIREALDENGFDNTLIMSYAAKYQSAFYHPFREAAGSAPQFGDRASYQMDPGNRREAAREIITDMDEGADMVMVKPALAYLDIVSDARAVTDLPLAAYNVSGEYAMVKAASASGWLDERRAVLEILTGIKRAGADMIITYHARDAAKWMRETSP